MSTVGRDEMTIRDYIRNQEKEDERLDQMNMWNPRNHGHHNHYPPVGGDMSACRFGLFAEDAAEGFFELGCCAFDVRLICV